MPTIHLIDGEKGGVGKSFFARVMVQYFINKNFAYTLVDADKNNPDVYNLYKDKSHIISFSEASKKLHDADKIFDLALKTPVIVNLPANIYNLVKLWIERNRLLDIGFEHGVDFCKWFVSNGGFDSVQMFKDSLKHYKNQLHHIFVRNQGLTDDWKFLKDDSELQELLNKYKATIKTIDFPLCDYYERYFLDAKKLPFSQILEVADIPLLSKQRIQFFLEDSYKQIAKILDVQQGDYQAPEEETF